MSEDEIQELKKLHEKSMISIGMSLTYAQDKHDELLKDYNELKEVLKESFCFIDFIIARHDSYGQAKTWKEKALKQVGEL